MILEPLPKEQSHKFDKDSLIYLSDDAFYYGEEVDKKLIEDIKNHNFQIYNGYYHYKKSWDSPKLYYTGRGRTCGKVKIKIQNYKPYCYIFDENGSYETYLDEKVERIILKGQHPRNIKRLRNHYLRKKLPLPCEADIRFSPRFLIDTYDYFKPTEAVEPKVCVFDVETNHPISDDIIAYSLNDQEDVIVFRSKYDDMYPSELALDAYERLLEFDVVTGWNIQFDIDMLHSPDRKILGPLDKIDKHLDYARKGKEYPLDKYIEMMAKGNRYFPTKEETSRIVNRLIELDYLKLKNGIVVVGSRKFNPIVSEEIAVINMIPIAKKMYAKEIRGRWSLDNTGIQICGIGKEHLGATRIGDLPEERLMEYNVVDTIIPEILDNELGGLEAHNILSWSLQSTIQDVMITAVVNDIALLRAYHRAKRVLYSRTYSGKDSKDAKYKAAEPDAIPGVYEGLVALDLKHAYPSAVISKNISAESKNPKGKYHTPPTPYFPNGVRYDDKHSVFIDTLKEIMDERGKVKKEMNKHKKKSRKWKYYKSIDFALKTQAAAFSHGIFGWGDSRMKDYEVADSITAVVRETLNLLKSSCIKVGVKWVYVHTDSVYVNIYKNKSKQLLTYLNNLLEETFKEDSIAPVLEEKGYYPYAYIHSPARNVLVPEGVEIDDDDNWEVTGMNFMRSETPEPLGDIEIELIKLKMKGGNEEELISKMKKMILDLPNKETNLLGLGKPLNKSIKEYGEELQDGSWGKIPYHITAYLKAKEEYGFDVPVGSKFFIIPILTDEIVGVRKIRRKVVNIAYSMEEGLPEQYKIDWENYLKSNLFGKIHNLFDCKPKELLDMVLTNDVKRSLGVPLDVSKEED